MVYSNIRIDPSKIPDGPCRDGLIHIAEQHDALVTVVESNQQDFNLIAGDTPEEKAATATVMQKVRAWFMAVHSNRFNITLIMGQIYLFLGALRLIGISVSPAQASHFIDDCLKILDRLSTQ